MTRVLRVLLVAAVWAFWSSSAGAVPVLITYDLPAAEGNSTPFLGGATPTGGTATLNVNLTSLNGSLSGATPFLSIRTIRFTHTTAGTVSFDDDPITNTIPQATPNVVAFTADPPPGWAFLGGEVTTLAKSSLLSIRAISTSLGAIRTLQGQEISRRLVPEPGTAFLGGLGLMALGGYASSRRLRRSKRA